MISYFNPLPHLWTGAGAVRMIPGHLKERGFRNPLVVTDKGVTALPFFAEITGELDSYSLFDKTMPNPPDVQVREGADLYKRDNCDCLIAMGGGSPMDCAKGIGVIVSNGGTIHAYTREPDTVPRAIPYLIAVPTTAGSGSECTSAAIITNTEGHHAKMALLSPKILPSAAFVDPEIMAGLPPSLTATTGLDAFPMPLKRISPLTPTNTPTGWPSMQSVSFSCTCLRRLPMAMTILPGRKWPMPKAWPVLRLTARALESCMPCPIPSARSMA